MKNASLVKTQDKGGDTWGTLSITRLLHKTSRARKVRVLKEVDLLTCGVGDRK